MQFVDIFRLRKPLREGAGMFEAADVDLKPVGRQGAGHVHDPVFHTAGVQGEQDVEDFDAAGGPHLRAGQALVAGMDAGGGSGW